MTEPNAMLKEILAADRPVKQRLSLLETVRDELKNEASVLVLLDAAREEKTLDLRSAFLDIALHVDITRLTDRNRYIDALLHFAAAEEDVSLRRTVIARLGKLAPDDPAVEEVLVETLCCDLDPETQAAALNALDDRVTKSPDAIKRLLEFAQISPPALRRDLIRTFSRLESTDAQDGLSIFLHPSEEVSVRKWALTKLGELPKRKPAVSAQIFKMVSSDPSAQIQQQAVQVLRDSKQMDPELFAQVFSLLARFPERTDLLEAVHHRLASFPQLLEALPELFGSVRSAQLRLRILELIKDAPVVRLFIKALSDPNWRVRRAAIGFCKPFYADYSEEIGPALVAAGSQESIVTVREVIARAFPERTRRSAAVDRLLLDWFERETEPRVQAALILALRAIPANGEHRAALLRAYRRILSEPFCSAELRQAILSELGNFHIEADPDYAGDLKAQLRRCRSVEEMETLYRTLRAAEPDPSAHAELLLELFYRFIGEYPRAILSDRLSDFQKMAAHDENVRRQIPYIVKLTGAGWILGAADTDAQKSALLAALLEHVRLDKTTEAVHLLDEAFEKRTIRKSDIVTFFKKLLPLEHVENVMDHVMILMQRGGIMTPEILETCFRYLHEEPRNGVFTSMISDFVQGRDMDHAPLRSINERRPDYAGQRRADPNYRAAVFEAFSQNGLLNYWGDLPEELDKPWEAKDTNDWEYQKWSPTGEDWTVARMFLDLKPCERILEILTLPIDPEISSSRTLQFMLLKKLWPELDIKFPDRLAVIQAVGTLFRNTREMESQRLLNDRAVLVFSTLWDRWINRESGLPELSADLAKMAAEIYAAVCARKAAFFGSEKTIPEVFPEILAGLDVEHLKSVWPLGPELWTALGKAHLDTLPDEMKARQMHARVLAVEDAGRFEECYALFGELLAMKQTRYVKTHYSILSYRQEDYDLSKPAGEDQEKFAQTKYEQIMEQVKKNDQPSRITHAIEYTFGKLWKTKFLTEHRAELLALRNKLRTVKAE